MPHRSRLNTVVIDVPDTRFAASTAFWATALGRQPNTSPAEAQPYLRLGGGEGGPDVVLQDPAGLFLCVIPAEGEDFEETATRWD